jgi:hypothetical protein
MKTILCILVIAILVSLSGKVLSQETVKGTIQFKSNSQTTPGGTGLSTATAVIPVPSQGAPFQIKAVITSRALLQGVEKNAQRYIFISSKEHKGSVFTVQDGNIVAMIGGINPQKEQVALFLVYKNASTNGKAAFSQVKVELTQ